jgi:hypothetical protein
VVAAVQTVGRSRSHGCTGKAVLNCFCLRKWLKFMEMEKQGDGNFNFSETFEIDRDTISEKFEPQMNTDGHRCF